MQEKSTIDILTILVCIHIACPFFLVGFLAEGYLLRVFWKINEIPFLSSMGEPSSCWGAGDQPSSQLVGEKWQIVQWWLTAALVPSQKDLVSLFFGGCAISSCSLMITKLSLFFHFSVKVFLSYVLHETFRTDICPPQKLCTLISFCKWFWEVGGEGCLSDHEESNLRIVNRTSSFRSL